MSDPDLRLRIRPLGCCERFFHLYARAFPVHFCLVAEIEGAIGMSALRAALEQVQSRHPALRVCVIDDADTGPAFYRTETPIDVRVVPTRADVDWRAAVEDELNRPFDTDPGPLMRVAALWGAGGASIVLTFHHAIADALSGVHILDDLMRALAGGHLDPLPLLPPVEAMIVAPDPQLAFALDRVSHVDIPARGREQMVQAPGESQAHISVLEWSPLETAGLMQRCRANGTTMHGAICAAASHHLPTSDERIVRMHSPLDLRRIAGIESGDCGVLIGAGVVEIPTANRKPLWLDARDVVDRLREVRSPAMVAGMLQWMAAELPPTATADKAAEFLAASQPSSAVISNLGVLPLATDYGPMVLKAVWGPAILTHPPADRQTIGVSTFAGRLRMVHQSCKPIPGLLDAIRETLRRSCV